MRIFILLFVFSACVKGAHGQEDSSSNPGSNNGVNTDTVEVRPIEVSTESQTVSAVGLTVEEILNLLGLLFITVGTLRAAVGSPSPEYGPDGSVSMSGEPDKKKRIVIYRWQKLFPWFLGIVGLGAAIQGVSILV